MQGDHPLTWLESCQRALKGETILKSQHPCSSFTPKGKSVVPGSSRKPFKIQRLSPEEMVDHEKMCICYNYDEKHVKVHRCHEHKLFHMHVNVAFTVDEVNL